jgi:hypothetical protein
LYGVGWNGWIVADQSHRALDTALVETATNVLERL